MIHALSAEVWDGCVLWYITMNNEESSPRDVFSTTTTTTESKKNSYWLKLIAMQFITSIGPLSSHLCTVIVEPRDIVSSPLHLQSCFSSSLHSAPLVLLTPKAADHVAQGTIMEQIICKFTVFHPDSFFNTAPIFKRRHLSVTYNSYSIAPKCLYL